jgi:hypothetical protein
VGHDSQCPSQDSNQASPKYKKHYCLKKLSHRQFGKQLKMVTVSSIYAVNFQLSFMKKLKEKFALRCRSGS